MYASYLCVSRCTVIVHANPLYDCSVNSDANKLIVVISKSKMLKLDMHWHPFISLPHTHYPILHSYLVIHSIINNIYAYMMSFSHEWVIIEHVSGTMSSVKGTLSSYDIYYHRLSEIFRLVAALVIPDKSGAGTTLLHPFLLPFKLVSYRAFVSIVPTAAKKKEPERVRITLSFDLIVTAMFGVILIHAPCEIDTCWFTRSYGRNDDDGIQ
jgi:hypothetical protein